MIKFEETKIREYEKLLREICNSTVKRVDWDKLEEKKSTFLQKMKEVFRFDNERGWKFLTSSLDIIGDTQLAITHFLSKKLNNDSTEIVTG